MCQTEYIDTLAGPFVFPFCCACLYYYFGSLFINSHLLCLYIFAYVCLVSEYKSNFDSHEIRHLYYQVWFPPPCPGKEK